MNPSDKSVSYDVEPVRMYIGSIFHVLLAHRDVVKPNPGIVVIVTASVVTGKIRYRTYDSKTKYKLAK